MSYISPQGKYNFITNNTGIFTLQMGPPIFLVFAILYVDNHFKKVKLWISLISIYSILRYFLTFFLWTDHKVQLDFFNTFSLLSSYTFVIIGIFLLIKNAVGKSNLEIRRSALLILSIFSPLFTDFLYQVPVLPHKPIDIVLTLSMVFSVLSMALITIQHKLLDIVPIAFHRIVENMKDSVLVVDNQNKILESNLSFKTTFGLVPSTYGNTNIAVLIENLKALSAANTLGTKIIDTMENSFCTDTSEEICILNPEKKYYNMNIQSLLNDSFIRVGRVIWLTDITQYKSMIQEINDKNDELSSMNEELTLLNEELTAMNEELTETNEKLKEHAEVVEELAVVKERNRIAGDIHDTLGHTLTVLVSILEVCNMTIDTDLHETKNKLNEGVHLAREGLKEVRRSIIGLKNGVKEKENLVETLETLMESFQSTGTMIHLMVDQDEIYLSPGYNEAIYRVCQEALTNSLRHGKATEINMIIKVNVNEIKLYIFDNGQGCEDIDISKGFGLSGMKNRIENLNGKIQFGSDANTGFNIRAEIPLKFKM